MDKLYLDGESSVSIEELEDRNNNFRTLRLHS